MDIIIAVILSCYLFFGFNFEMEVMNEGIEGVIRDYWNMRKDKRNAFIFITCLQLIMMCFLWLPAVMAGIFFFFWNLFSHVQA
ncbi:MAG: hypothetical protein ISS02_00940 [Candidatus Portnoybacteria bacterium]|nr:hypothetical protein [Candidatus Portnoybacteria bacterium]